MRELKPFPVRYVKPSERSRTPPGVRELKPIALAYGSLAHIGRTPPGVRELKLVHPVGSFMLYLVAPLPGCVN